MGGVVLSSGARVRIAAGPRNNSQEMRTIGKRLLDRGVSVVLVAGAVAAS